MSDPNLLGDETDRPIIIQGGGSVNIIVPPNFEEQPQQQASASGYEQTAGRGNKDFKNGDVNLVSLQIDDDKPITLNKNSKITIIYQ